jgi:hypothetical protein
MLGPVNSKDGSFIDLTGKCGEQDMGKPNPRKFARPLPRGRPGGSKLKNVGIWGNHPRVGNAEKRRRGKILQYSMDAFIALLHLGGMEHWG